VPPGAFHKADVVDKKSTADLGGKQCRGRSKIAGLIDVVHGRNARSQKHSDTRQPAFARWERGP
jgi:hypothetical protein